MRIGRKESQWEETIYDLSPVEEVAGIRFKREDKYAPLGYGSINGSKLRQLIWLVHQYRMKGGEAGLLSGASVKSPQLSMGTAVASHFGLPATHVIGATNPVSSMKHSDVEIATMLGATFEYSKVAYNGALQSMVSRLLGTPKYAGYFHLEYGITLDHRKHDPATIEAFHRVGAEQVKNIPECDALIIPSGSCNSLTSILYGLSIYKPKVKKLVLVEIGPSRRDWVAERLGMIQSTLRALPYDVTGAADNYEVTYHDLHGSKYTSYQDTMKYQHEDIAFHPRYEGKVMTYLSDRCPELLNTDNIVWIVAGESKVERIKEVAQTW